MQWNMVRALAQGLRCKLYANNHVNQSNQKPGDVSIGQDKQAGGRGTAKTGRLNPYFRSGCRNLAAKLCALRLEADSLELFGAGSSRALEVEFNRLHANHCRRPL